MAATASVISFDKGYVPDPSESLFTSMFRQYERVLIESLVTSFGLDFIVKDQHGGDVDTIHSVREVGVDGKMTYKSTQNQYNYEHRGEYDRVAYHKDPRYTNTVKAAKSEFDQHGTKVADAYIPSNQVIPRMEKNISRGQQGQLDHVMSAEDIHNDPGRVLAGMDGLELANRPENLRYTNAALNRNMSNMSVDEYIAWCEANPSKVDWNGKKGEPLPEEVKDRLRKEYQRAKKDYDAKLACTYYTSVQFRKDVTYAAVNVGARMGVRQALGFVFAEIWFAIKDELQKFDKQEADIKDYLEAIASGIEAGVSNVKKRYPEMCSRFLNGAAAGALSSLTTTLCNIFFTTAKSTVRIIRQSYASIVQAMEVLFINPDNYEFGDRMRAVVKVLSIGASVTVGVLVSDAVARTQLGVLGKTGEIIQSFCGAFVTGIMSCTLLMYLDRSKITNQLVQQLNNIHTLADIELQFSEDSAGNKKLLPASLLPGFTQALSAEEETNINIHFETPEVKALICELRKASGKNWERLRTNPSHHYYTGAKLIVRVFFKNLMGQWCECIISHEIAWLAYKNPPPQKTHNLNENTIPPKEIREGDEFKAVLSSHHIAPFVFAMTTDKHVIDILQGYTDESPWLSAVLKDNCT